MGASWCNSAPPRTSLGDLWAPLGCFWDALGSLWPLLSRSWALLGHSWDACAAPGVLSNRFGTFKGRSGSHFGLSWSLLVDFWDTTGAKGELLGRFGTFMDRSGSDFALSWSLLGDFWATSGAQPTSVIDFHNALLIRRRSNKSIYIYIYITPDIPPWWPFC